MEGTGGVSHSSNKWTIFEAKYPDAQGNVQSDVNSLLANITNGWLFPRCIPV